jgi:hypothetical protein
MVIAFLLPCSSDRDKWQGFYKALVKSWLLLRLSRRRIPCVLTIPPKVRSILIAFYNYLMLPCTGGIWEAVIRRIQLVLPVVSLHEW